MDSELDWPILARLAEDRFRRVRRRSILDEIENVRTAGDFLELLNPLPELFVGAVATQNSVKQREDFCVCHRVASIVVCWFQNLFVVARRDHDDVVNVIDFATVLNGFGVV